jgi:hypothetical protein
LGLTNSAAIEEIPVVIGLVLSRRFIDMTKTAVLLTLITTAVASMPAQAQPGQQVLAFVSGHGADVHSCTLTQPCRTFHRAFNTIPPNGVIWVLDPADYQPLTITHGVSIQAGGMGAITVTSGDAITVSVTTSDPVTLNGLILDGVGTGQNGINITSGPSVQILNSVVHNFALGISDRTASSGSKLLIEDTVTSDNLTGVAIAPTGAGGVKATLNRITANNNTNGVGTTGNDTTIANSVLSNNDTGLLAQGGVTWLAKTVISGNTTGVQVIGTVNSYGDNYIRDNRVPVNGSLTPVMTQ